MTKLSIKFILCAICLGISGTLPARKQWSVAQAWKWQAQMGEIRGFNQPELAYPGMLRNQILRKAAELGLNSVRSWVSGGTVEEQIAFIRKYAEDCDRYGLTYSPVMSFYDQYYRDKSLAEDEALQKTEAFIHAVVSAFAKDRRIAMWDIWNEPSTAVNEETMRQMGWLEKMLGYARSADPVQPVTASIIWEGGEYDTTNVVFARRMEIEKMMDIHNIHNYRFLEAEHWKPAEVIAYVKAMDGRPVVSSECLARTVSGGLTRTLKLFAREHVNFYLWGMFLTDNKNWSVQWGRSTYDPYEPIFHDLLYSDGTPYDARELSRLRNFRFEARDEQIYPPLAQTERWPAERAWKWVASGPILGVQQNLRQAKFAKAANSVRVKLSFEDFAADEAGFLQRFEKELEDAASQGMTVLPVLVSDEDIKAADRAEIPQAAFLRTYDNDFAENGDGYMTTPFRHAGQGVSGKAGKAGKAGKTASGKSGISGKPGKNGSGKSGISGNAGNSGKPNLIEDAQAGNPFYGTDFAPSLRIPRSVASDFAQQRATRNIMAYINVILRRYYIDSRIAGWELYHHPGSGHVSEAQASCWVSQLFDLARYSSPSQPCFMTPLVSVGGIPPGVDYRAELIHGRRAGWNRLMYAGASTPALTYKIWALSDITAFSSAMKSAETGWLVSICYRFGRPIWCTEWQAPDLNEAKATLDSFSRSHVYWYTDTALPAELLTGFRFRPINTDRDSAQLVP